MQPQQPQPEQVMQPQPTPESWITQVIPQAVGPNIVLLNIHSVTGVHVSFMSADQAISLGEQFTNIGRQAKSGLIIPQNGAHTLPKLNGNNGR